MKFSIFIKSRLLFKSFYCLLVWKQRDYGWQLAKDLNLYCKISEILRISFSYWQGFVNKFLHLHDCTFKQILINELSYLRWFIFGIIESSHLWTFMKYFHFHEKFVSYHILHDFFFKRKTLIKIREDLTFWKTGNYVTDVSVDFF